MAGWVQPTGLSGASQGYSRLNALSRTSTTIVVGRSLFRDGSHSADVAGRLRSSLYRGTLSVPTHVPVDSALRGPLDSVESIPAAFRTDVVLESEVRTTAFALVGVGVVMVTACDCRFDAAQSAHGESSQDTL